MSSSECISSINERRDEDSKDSCRSAMGIIVFGMFMVGFDQSHLFSVAQGEQAYEDLWMHEFYHAMRHATGFPCHLTFLLVDDLKK
jgi:Probable cobalt transporter subunit (CbtB)